MTAAQRKGTERRNVFPPCRSTAREARCLLAVLGSADATPPMPSCGAAAAGRYVPGSGGDREAIPERSCHIKKEPWNPIRKHRVARVEHGSLDQRDSFVTLADVFVFFPLTHELDPLYRVAM